MRPHARREARAHQEAVGTQEAASCLEVPQAGAPLGAVPQQVELQLAKPPGKQLPEPLQAPALRKEPATLGERARGPLPRKGGALAEGEVRP